MKTSSKGVDLIKFYEGKSNKPYLCPANYWTIGYGHVISKEDAKKYSSGISDPIIEALLKKDLEKFERGVLRLIKVHITQEQFDALVSFAFNLGLGALQRSSLRAKINRQEYEAAAAEFSKWVWGGGKKLPGLVKRRAAEASLFLAGTETA
jgi:lysozyme